MTQPVAAGPALPEELVERVPGFESIGVLAFTTTRAFGSFGTQTEEPVAEVMGRWQRLQEALPAERLATARQVHGGEIIEHVGAWRGWLRGPAADGHLALERGTALVVTVADCVPVFVAHPAGATALLHSGWRGTEADITGRAIARLVASGLRAADLVVHAGPAICGRCYEVSPDVVARLTGRTVAEPTTVDLRALIVARARELGVRQVSASESCTRCDNERFYSHRAGDPGRQLGVLLAPRAGEGRRSSP